MLTHISKQPHETCTCQLFKSTNVAPNDIYIDKILLTKTKMTQLIKKQHYGKIWSQTPCTDVYNIHIRHNKQNTQDAESKTTTDVHRLVFHLPLKYLRSEATSICEFKKNVVVSPFVDAFCFYLNFIEELYTNPKYTKDGRKHMKMFLEDVYDENGHKVALRFHFFVECTINFLHEVKKDILNQHSSILRKRKRTTNKNVEIYENYKEIYDDFTWSKMVSAYKMKSDCMDNAYNPFINTARDDNSNETEMLGVFNENTHLFSGNFLNSNNKMENSKICMTQKDYNYYNKDNVCCSMTDTYNGDKCSCYVFPMEEAVVMVHPSEVFIHEIFIKKKYLPYYMRERILLPKVEVECVADNTINISEVIVLALFKVPHEHINAKIGYIGEEKKTVIEYLNDESIGTITTEDYKIYKVKDDKDHIKKNTIKTNIKEYFQVCEIEQYPTQDFVIFESDGNAGFCSFQKKYRHQSLEFLSLFAHNGNTQIEDPVERAALTDKHTLDTLDFLKYEGIILKKTHQNKVFEREHVQEELFKKFKEDVVENPYTIVSEPLRVILDWGLENKRHQIKRKKYKDYNDTNGMWKHENVFMNSMNWKMDVFDNDLQVATGHSSLMMLHHSKYDAYRQTMDLHMNIIFTGEGATSKSFLFEKMRQMSIPATVVELTYQTSKADAIDGDRNDTITVFNEAPAGLFMTNKHTDPGDEARFKEKLTSQRVSCKTYEKDEETGLRTNRTTVSQSIGVYMGATNDDPADATEAMRTRFYFGQFEKSERKNKSMDACMQGEKIWNDIGEDLLEKTMNDFHMEHYKMALLFKLMYIGAIKYPTLTTSDIVFMKMSEKLRKMKLNTSTRFKERFDILCRIYTMINAIELIFNYETNEVANYTSSSADAVFYKKNDTKPTLSFEEGVIGEFKENKMCEKNCCGGTEDDPCYEDTIFECGNIAYCLHHKSKIIKSDVDPTRYGKCAIRCKKCQKKAQYIKEKDTKPSLCIDHREPNMKLYGNHCGMDFDVRQLRDVEPLLYCTEEIAVFAFTQLSLEVCNPAESKVINSMYDLWKQRGSMYQKSQEDEASFNYNISVIKINNIKQLVKMISTNIPIQYGRPSDHNIKMVLKELSSRNISHTPYVMTTNNVKAFCYGDVGGTYLQIQDTNQNYIVNTKVKKITDCFNIIDREIHIATELFKNCRLKDGKKNALKDSTANIQLQNKLQHMQVEEEDLYNQSGYGYDRDDPYNVSGYEQNVIPTTDSSNHVQTLNVEFEKEDILSEAVNEIQHKYLKEKYVMFGLPYRDVHGTIEKPNKFHMKKIAPSNTLIKLKNPIFKSNESLLRRQRRDLRQQEKYVGEVIVNDLNLHAARSHCNKLFPPEKEKHSKHKNRLKEVNERIVLQNKQVEDTFVRNYAPESYEKKYIFVEEPILNVNENAAYIENKII